MRQEEKKQMKTLNQTHFSLCGRSDDENGGTEEREEEDKQQNALFINTKTYFCCEKTVARATSTFITPR